MLELTTSDVARTQTGKLGGVRGRLKVLKRCLCVEAVEAAATGLVATSHSERQSSRIKQEMKGTNTSRRGERRRTRGRGGSADPDGPRGVSCRLSQGKFASWSSSQNERGAARHREPAQRGRKNESTAIQPLRPLAARAYTTSCLAVSPACPSSPLSCLSRSL